MKKTAYLLLVFLLTACSGSYSHSRYQKSIRDYVLNGRSDVKFKVLEISKIGTISVADSIDYLTNEFRKDKEVIIKRIELAKAMTKELQANTKLKSEYDQCSIDINRMNNSIDSLKNLPPDNLQGYDKRNPTDVLSIIIRCKYLLDASGTTVEETFDFYLSPDGRKVIKKLNPDPLLSE